MRENYSLICSQLIDKLFALPLPLHISSSLWSSTLPCATSFFNLFHTTSLLSLNLSLSHQCSLEGWVASSIYFPLGCRWFCSLPAIHIPDHRRRSQSHPAPALLRCDCHSWEYLDLCRLLQANLKGKHIRVIHRHTAKAAGVRHKMHRKECTSVSM